MSELMDRLARIKSEYGDIECVGIDDDEVVVEVQFVDQDNPRGERIAVFE